MSERYPILVARWTGEQATWGVCLKCGAEGHVDPMTHNTDSDDSPCPSGCGGRAVFKYVEADKCPNCGKLGFYDRVLGYCCSRPCMFQAEYAAQLAARRDGGR